MSVTYGGRTWHNKPVTPAQVNFILSLAKRTGQVVDPSILTRGSASNLIEQLKQLPVSQGKGNAVTEELLPRHMLDLIEDGRYALRNDADNAYIFLRVSHPKAGRRAGAFKLQTQHSDQLSDLLVIGTDGNEVYRRRGLVRGMKLVDLLTTLVVEQKKAAILYGQRLEQCCRCGRKLTDSRSRYYGIGSECENTWSWVVSQVNEQRGEYFVGADR